MERDKPVKFRLMDGRFATNVGGQVFAEPSFIRKTRTRKPIPIPRKEYWEWKNNEQSRLTDKEIVDSFFK